MSIKDYSDGILLGFIIGVVIIGVTLVLMSLNEFTISKETAKDICINLTGNKTVEASTQNGKLICTVPSYDNTTNIIVKRTGEK